jgi:Ca2+-binding EF-hand superfamily protein
VEASEKRKAQLNHKFKMDPGKAKPADYYLELVDAYSRHLTSSIQTQLMRREVVGWMRTAPIQQAIVVKIPFNIEQKCRTQKIVANNHVSPQVFNRSLDKLLGITAETNLDGTKTGFSHKELKEGSIYHCSNHLAEWDETRANTINARAMALQRVIGPKTASSNSYFNCFGGKNTVVQNDSSPDVYFYGDVVFYGIIKTSGYIGSSISAANVSLLKEGIYVSGKKITKQRKEKKMSVLSQISGADEAKISVILNDIFDQYDIDRNESLSIPELHAMMVEMNIVSASKNPAPDEDTAQKVMEALDTDKDGTLSKEELITWLMNGLKQNKETLDTFCSKGGHYFALHGFLESIIAEIKAHAESRRIKLSGMIYKTELVKNTLNNVFSQYDADNDGTLSEDEISAMAVELNISSGLKANVPDLNMASEILKSLTADKQKTLEQKEFVKKLLEAVKETDQSSTKSNEFNLFLKSIKMEIEKRLK